MFTFRFVGFVFVGVFFLAANDAEDIDFLVLGFGQVVEENEVVLEEGIGRYSDIVH